MNELKKLFKSVVVQIATPYSTGTGFCLKEHRIIVTSDNVVRDNREVIVEGEAIDRQLTRVIYSDPKYDLAFLELPHTAEVPDVRLALGGKFKENEPVLALGHAFSEEYVMKEGRIATYPSQHHDMDYLLHTAVTDAINSGGPLINPAGLIVGVNTFANWEDDETGLALDVKYLRNVIDDFHSGSGEVGVRCFACSKVTFGQTHSKSSCAGCGALIGLPSEAKVFKPEGIGKSIESLLAENGYAVALARIGPNNWEVREGSARIDISYYEKTGLIVGDAYLCYLPPSPSKSLYEYLLKQNYRTQGLAFSVKGRDVVLSLLIYDRYLNADTATRLFMRLFERADYYDNVLVEQYGALWKHED